MRNYSDNIKNEIAYFYTTIKNMDIKDRIKKSRIKEHEISIAEVMYDNFPDDFDMERQLSQRSLLGWIELIQNEDLHKAVASLSIEDQIFISYIVKECRTQRELSEIYNVTHQSISKRFIRIIKRLRQFMKK